MKAQLSLTKTKATKVSIKKLGHMFTIRDLAQKAGVAPSTLYNILNDTHRPSESTYETIKSLRKRHIN